MATLLRGFGGAADFGENYLSRNDDSYQNNIDITSVFGVQGLNFFGTSYTKISINNNGNITFGGTGLSTYTPFGLQNSSYPMIAAFFGDVDTRGGGTSPTAGGTSTGANLVWYDLDPITHKLTITWDDVGYYSSNISKLNAFQIQLTGTGGGGFDIDFRYEDINWTTGNASGGSGGLGGSVARAGYSTGDGVTSYELSQSGNQNNMLALESTTGNTGTAGLYHFSVNSGTGLLASDTILSLEGDGNTNVGLVRVMADFSKAAYHLEATENKIINDFSPNADQTNANGTTNTNLNAALTDLGNQGWRAIAGLTPAFQSSTSVVTGQTITNQMFSDGFYVNGNAAACVMRCGDAAVISFRGTNDNGDSNLNDPGNTIAPDTLDWINMPRHYALLQPLITAFDQYVSANGISKVYVTGHSLGGAMAINYMANHLAVDRPGIAYQAITFAAPGYAALSYNDPRLTHIEIGGDPVPDLGLHGSRTINFYGDQTTPLTVDTNNHSMDYYRQITDSVDSDSWATILQTTGDQTVLLGAVDQDRLLGINPQHGINFIVDGELNGTNTNLVTSQNPTTLAPPNPTAGDNTLTDPTFSDYNFFYGGQGNDTLTGGGASETFLGGTGVDSMTGAAGNDTYYVDDARDLTIEYAGVVGGWDSVYTSVTYTLAANVEAIVLTGTAINATGNVDHNYLVGNGANNTLDGQGGADDMVGRAGNDTYIVDNAGDTVTENVGEGRDAVCAYIHYALGNNVEDLWLYGTTNLNGYGNALNNYLVGNSGNNKLDGQGGADVMSGGLGDDIYVVENAGDVVTETTAVGGGWDGVYSSVSYSLGANVEALVLTGTAGIGGYGNADHNYIVGNDMGNILDGRGGADDMAGGLGGDIYYVDNALDTTTESVNAGWDSVYSSTLSYTLSVNVEALVLLEGSAATTAIGNTAYNYMVGNSAANIFDGKGGGDFMVGGNGNDTYTVYNSNDTIVEYANEGWDVVWSSGSYALSANVDSLWLSGTANVNAYGNGDYNYLVGNNGNNLLDGQGGNDLIFGGEGADIFVGSLGRDVYNLTETTAATDTIRVATGDSLAVSGNYDFATGFKLGTGTVSTTGVDQLDLVSTLIAGNTAATNGINAGAIMSHSITNGIINFATSDTFAAAPLTLSDGYLDNVFSYLQANIAGSQTVGFVCSGNSYVFQDGGVTDTLVELVGVVATSLNNTGLAANSVWIV